MKRISIAIDGPASAGKSTIAKIIAKKNGFIYLDTGAMYRTVTWLALENNVSFSDEQAILSLMKTGKINFKQEKDGQHVFWNDIDVTKAIRTSIVTSNVSEVSAHKLVRETLVTEQQEYAKNGEIVMDGRDIGTYVLPNAEVKIFLIASVDERAKRRYKENLAKGLPADLEELKVAIQKRDEYDSNRLVSPLKKADDAIEIDTTGLSIEQVVEKIEEIIKKKVKKS